MPITTINTDKAPQAIGPYSQAVKAAGFLFLSGQLGIDPPTGELASADVSGQTVQALTNLKEVLASQKLTFADVVETTIYLTEMSDFQKVNAIYSETMAGHKPARATVQVAGLPRNAKIEIKMTAVFP